MFLSRCIYHSCLSPICAHAIALCIAGQSVIPCLSDCTEPGAGGGGARVKPDEVWQHNLIKPPMDIVPASNPISPTHGCTYRLQLSDLHVKQRTRLESAAIINTETRVLVSCALHSCALGTYTSLVHSVRRRIRRQPRMTPFHFSSWIMIFETAIATRYPSSVLDRK